MPHPPLRLLSSLLPPHTLCLTIHTHTHLCTELFSPTPPPPHLQFAQNLNAVKNASSFLIAFDNNLVEIPLADGTQRSHQQLQLIRHFASTFGSPSAASPGPDGSLSMNYWIVEINEGWRNNRARDVRFKDGDCRRRIKKDRHAGNPSWPRHNKLIWWVLAMISLTIGNLCWKWSNGLNLFPLLHQ